MQMQGIEIPRPQAAKDVVLILPELYGRQAELLMAFYRNPAIRYLVGAFGSKAGKSYGASIVFVKHAWETPDSVNWWIAPSYAQAEVGKDYIKKLLPKGTWDESRKENMITIFKPNGDPHSEMWFKTAEDEDKLRGFRVHLIVADEMARIKEAAYDSFRTTVIQTRGRIIFLSTPKGHNLFYDFFQRGNKSRLGKGEIDLFPDWFSMRLPTWANPWVRPEDIEDARNSMPAEVFRQEIEAEFLDNSSTVFGTYKECIHGIWDGIGEPPDPHTRYGVGLDLARSHDYTVITVVDLGRRRVVYFERFNEIDWQLQYTRIITVCQRYNNALLIMDATSQGDPIFNTLQLSGLNVIPYRFYTNTAKREAIENLRVMIEQRKISYPNIPELMRELEDYEIHITPGGVVQYSAPRGRQKFDDCVPKGTLIRTSNGPLPIEKVCVGDSVLTHLGRYRKVTRVGSRHSDVVYRIKSTGKLPVTLTDNHKLYVCKRFSNWSKSNTIDYKSPEWVSVSDGLDLTNYGLSYPINKDVQGMDYIDLLPFCPKGYRVEDEFLVSYVKTNNRKKDTWRLNCNFNKIPRFVKVDEDFCQMLGYYAAEGSCGAHSVAFASHIKEKPIRDWLGAYLTGLGFRPSIVTTSENGVALSFGSVVLKNLFSTFLKSNHKKLPVWAESLEPDKQKYILFGYFLGDGCFSGGLLTAATISPYLAFQLYEMLLRLGLPVGIRKLNGKRKYFKERNIFSNCKNQFVLSLDRSITVKFINLIEKNSKLFSCKVTKVPAPNKVQTQMKVSDKYITGKIKEVECLSHNDLVYNLEVADDNSYVANGVIVHNCVISLALVAMLLNQPENKYIYCNERGV